MHRDEHRLPDGQGLRRTGSSAHVDRGDGYDGRRRTGQGGAGGAADQDRTGARRGAPRLRRGQRMRTGVIVGVNGEVTHALAGEIIKRLEHRFPGVTFDVVPWGVSVSFQYPDPPAKSMQDMRDEYLAAREQ